MSNFRFEVGTFVMCNLGPSGWKLGRIIALNYREDHWPVGKDAPYQVLLEEEGKLIYVPEDDVLYCREATQEDLRIALRMDALAPLPVSTEGSALNGPIASQSHKGGALATEQSSLSCTGAASEKGSPSYRDGRCKGCGCCPRAWTQVELYSEHYRCAERNDLKVTQCSVDLGSYRVGDSIQHAAGDSLPTTTGFLQSPMLVRLPPGVRFSDDGGLAGQVRYDPYRPASYRVDFVAVSTADWKVADVGIVRLEISFLIEGNEPPADFDVDAFAEEQERARALAERSHRSLGETWELWEEERLGNRETCDRMLAELRKLRELLERYPRLDGGKWWAQLGGYHMNVHKLLENTLFECELYLGHALTFEDAEVRWYAEQNLEGCFQKRLLEAARFMWIDGLEQMMRGNWAAAAEILRQAASKKDGWGWAVNFGDIWFSESAARLVHGAELTLSESKDQNKGLTWIAEAERLLDRGVARTNERGYFGDQGHPWAAEIRASLATYKDLRAKGVDTSEWLVSFKQRTVYWCAQVLAGAAPFPPRPRPRIDDAAELIARLPGHNN